MTANSLRQKKFSLSIVEGDPVVSVAHCKLYMYMYVTILNLILRIEKKKKISILKNAHLLVKVVSRSIDKRMRFRKMLIYCVKLDHALYSINYGSYPYSLLYLCSAHTCTVEPLITDPPRSRQPLYSGQVPCYRLNLA